MTTTHTDDALGVDIGGVIIDRVNDTTNTSFFGDRYLETTAVSDAFAALRTLRERRFGPRIFLVSNCGANIQRKTLDWLAHHEFSARTGIPPDHVRFCRTRNGKAPICTELGITHFVDDRLKVLGYLTNVPFRYLFRPNPREVVEFAQHLTRVSSVNSWDALLQRLLVS